MVTSTDEICREFPQIAADLQHFIKHATLYRNLVGGDTGNIDLKAAHSLCVLKISAQIIGNLRPPEDLADAILLAALYHDFGRFAQYLKYKTFLDRNSVNHGTLGAQEMVRHKLPLEAPSGLRSIILGGVAVHNRLSLPENLPDKLNLLARVVRDADKIDIMRIMDEHFNRPENSDPVVTLHLQDRPDTFTASILNTVLQGQTPSYDDLRLVNDFKILLASWLHTLNFPISREILLRSGRLESIIATLSQSARLPLLAFIRTQKCSPKFGQM